MGSITTKVKIGDENENVINPMKDETGQSILAALGGSTQFTTYTNTAVTLTTAHTAYKLPSTEQSNRELLVVYNSSNYDVYIGGSSVSTANGLLLVPGATLSIMSTSGIYAVCGTDNATIRVFEAK